jgi:hypothetical protein
MKEARSLPGARVGEGLAPQAKLRYLALAAFFPKAEAREILQCSIRNVASRDNDRNAQKAVQLSAVLSRIFRKKAFCHIEVLL